MATYTTPRYPPGSLYAGIYIPRAVCLLCPEDECLTFIASAVGLTLLRSY
jgi:hypothetical protein